MAIEWKRHQSEFEELGYTVFRNLIPADLIRTLRIQSDLGRELARKKGGLQVQRLQPVYSYTELDRRPFDEFHALPLLREAVTRLLSAKHERSKVMGVLFEPAERPWCTTWHRDWFNVKNLDAAEFAQACANTKMFSQFNAPLYDDASLWVVPGSHVRKDTDGESVFPKLSPESGPTFEGLDHPVDVELACRQYVETMPGGTQLLLRAGDFALYRASLWHLGNYLPYVKRATLHDGFYGPDDRAWHQRMVELGAIKSANF